MLRRVWPEPRNLQGQGQITLPEVGTCAVCGQEKEVTYCALCDKMLCSECKGNYPARFKAAVRELWF
jgi:hypothetical protein